MVAGSTIPTSAFERLLEASDDIVFALDRLGRIRHLNAAFERHTGFAPAVWLGRHWLELAADPEADGVRALLTNPAPACGPPRRLDVRTAGGATRRLTVRTTPAQGTAPGVAVLGTARPEAPPERAEGRLRAAETRFQRVFHALPAPATIQRLADGRFLWVNDAYVRACGYRRHELLGRTPRELGLWADPRDRSEAVARLRDRGALDSFQTRMRTRSGEVRSMLCSWVAIDLDETPCIFNIDVDVTFREQAEAQLRELPLRLVEAQELERKRIARELHDEIGQALTGLRMQLMTIPHAGAPEEPSVSDALDTVARLIDEVRTLSLDLHARVLEDIGLEAALRDFADRHLARAGVRVHLELTPGTGALPQEASAACFRVAQEALTNVVRHAGAGNVWVRLRRSRGALELRVEDDGVGMDPAAAPEGFGLKGMRERTVLAGGRLELGPRPGGGTRVVARLRLGNEP